MLKTEKFAEELAAKIENFRKEMITCGLNYGLSNERTIELSQLLDIYITNYQVSKTQKFQLENTN